MDASSFGEGAKGCVLERAFLCDSSIPERSHQRARLQSQVTYSPVSSRKWARQFQKKGNCKGKRKNALNSNLKIHNGQQICFRWNNQEVLDADTIAEACAYGLFSKSPIACMPWHQCTSKGHRWRRQAKERMTGQFQPGHERHACEAQPATYVALL